MADNIHPVVELLAARMETHPEEFGENGSRRWDAWMTQMEALLTEEERLLLRRPEMQEIHEEVLDELLNGEQRRAERRALEEKERELQMRRYQQQYQQATMQQNAYANQAGAYRNAMGIGNASPSQPLVIGTGKEAMRIQANGDIQIGSETLNEGLIKKIKGALKL